jgi:hypothetical protein
MAKRSWRTWLAGHRRTRLVLGKGTGIERLWCWTSWKSRRLRNSWAGLGVDRSRRTRSPVQGGHGGYWEQVPRKGWRKGHGGHGLPVIGGRHGWYWGRIPGYEGGCGLHGKVGACGTVGLVWALIGDGGRGRRSKVDTAGTGNRYRGKDAERSCGFGGTGKRRVWERWDGGFGIGGSGCVWGCGGELLVGQVLRRT